MGETGGSAGRRLSVITVDQVIAGGSNVLAAVLAARLLGLDSFARFEIVFIIYVLVQGIARALCCEPLLVHPQEADERPGDALGTTLVVSALLGLVVLGGAAITLIWDPPTALGLVILAFGLPLLSIQDVGRYLAFSTQRPTLALIVDSIWLVLLIVLAVTLDIVGMNTLSWVLVVWVGSGAIAGMYVLWRYRSSRMRPNLTWLRETWGFSWRYLLSFTAGQGTSLSATLALGGLVDARAIGAARGAALMVRPSLTIHAAGAAASTAEIARNARTVPDVRSTATKVTAVISIVGTLNLVALLVLPDWIGVQFLGDTWEAAKPYFLPAGLQMIFVGIVAGMRSGMLGMREVQKVVKLDLWANPILLVLAIGGTYADGLRGFCWGCAAAAVVTAAIWVRTFVVTSRTFTPGPDGGDEPETLVSADPIPEG